MTAPALQAKRLGLRQIEPAQARDERDGHIGQDRHLQQLDVDIRADLEKRDPFSEEHAG